MIGLKVKFKISLCVKHSSHILARFLEFYERSLIDLVEYICIFKGEEYPTYRYLIYLTVLDSSIAKRPFCFLIPSEVSSFVKREIWIKLFNANSNYTVTYIHIHWINTIHIYLSFLNYFTKQLTIWKENYKRWLFLII